MLLRETPREPGVPPVAIRLYRDGRANVTVPVGPEGYTPEEAAALAALNAEQEAEALAVADESAPDETGEAAADAPAETVAEAATAANVAPAAEAAEELEEGA